MWFFKMTLEERVKYQKCKQDNCGETGIFSPDNCRTWYCGKHMGENYARRRSIQS